MKKLILMLVIVVLLALAGQTNAVAKVNTPPDPAGYFDLKPVGTWDNLPTGGQCKKQIHYSSWEPRPDNAYPNHRKPDASAVHKSLARQRTDAGAYNDLWFDWLLPRVAGQFAGTTDEHFQWAACKWGLADNLLRAVAIQESTWYQYEVYPSGRPVSLYGSGDYFSGPSGASHFYCDRIGRFGRDYQNDYGDGLCPKTFSILGIMSWEDPSWGKMAGNQNGTFPFNRNSVGFAVDYYGAHIRGCYEGWEQWLGPNYGPGDLWGCVGAWYSGDWHSQAANNYIQGVKNWMASKRWLDASWPSDKPGCNSFGCPTGWHGY